MNPRIEIANYFRITVGNYDLLPAPAAAISAWGPLYFPPAEGEEVGVEMTQANSTMHEVIDAARAAGAIRTSPPFQIEHVDGQTPLRDSDITAATHWIIPLTGIGGDFDAQAVQLATMEAVPYSHVKLSHGQALTYLQTGTLPS